LDVFLKHKTYFQTKINKYNYTGVTKAISAPSKPPKTVAAAAIYSDTDDDDLSDISERSREEDISDPVGNKNAQSLPTESTDIKKNQALTATNSDADKLPSIPIMAPKSTVQARRLEKSDSDDTTSGADSQAVIQSVAESFYSPVESVDDGTDTDDQPTASWRERVKNEINQVISPDIKRDQALSKTSTQRQKQNDTPDEDDDEQDKSSAESSSTESQKTPVPVGRMAFGEPYIHIYSARLYAVYILILCVFVVYLLFAYLINGFERYNSLLFSSWNVCFSYFLFTISDKKLTYSYLFSSS
jgi:hypothetical protein